VKHASSVLRADRVGEARGVPVREYSFVVEGKLSASTIDEDERGDDGPFGPGTVGASTDAVAGMQS
jgi:hypothetical protein